MSVTELLTESERNYAANAEDGKVRVNLTKTVGAKTDYSGGAKNASLNMPASVTSGSEKVGNCNAFVRPLSRRPYLRRSSPQPCLPGLLTNSEGLVWHNCKATEVCEFGGTLRS